MPNGFDALTTYCTAVAVNLDTSTPGVLKPTPIAGTTTASISLSATGGQPVVTFRNRIEAAAVSTSGTYARAQLTGPTTGTPKTWNNVFIGHAAASGDAWDFDGNQVRLTFSGANSVTPGVGATVWSDWVAISVDETKPLIVAIDSTDNNITRNGTSLGSNYNAHYVEAAGDAGTTNPSGYLTAAGYIVALSAVAVKSTTDTASNLTVSSTSFTAASMPTTMKVLARVKEVDAAVAGTDYTMECSRDGGTTYTAMTLTEKFSTPGGIRIVESADTSVTAQPSGTAPRWRFKTLNNKMVELHDVYFYWN